MHIGSERGMYYLYSMGRTAVRLLFFILNPFFIEVLNRNKRIRKEERWSKLGTFFISPIFGV